MIQKEVKGNLVKLVTKMSNNLLCLLRDGFSFFSFLVGDETRRAFSWLPSFLFFSFWSKVLFGTIVSGLGSFSHRRTSRRFRQGVPGKGKNFWTGAKRVTEIFWPQKTFRPTFLKQFISILSSPGSQLLPASSGRTETKSLRSQLTKSFFQVAWRLRGSNILPYLVIQGQRGNATLVGKSSSEKLIWFDHFFNQLKFQYLVAPVFFELISCMFHSLNQPG